MVNRLFEIGEEVQLPQAVHKELFGKIIAILIDRDGVQYRVRYFWESKPQDVYFYENELKSKNNG
jgi:hypothetical protein